MEIRIERSLVSTVFDVVTVVLVIMMWVLAAVFFSGITMMWIPAVGTFYSFANIYGSYHPSLHRMPKDKRRPEYFIYAVWENRIFAIWWALLGISALLAIWNFEFVFIPICMVALAGICGITYYLLLIFKL